jgi:hypothetical protein
MDQTLRSNSDDNASRRRASLSTIHSMSPRSVASRNSGSPSRSLAAIVRSGAQRCVAHRTRFDAAAISSEGFRFRTTVIPKLSSPNQAGRTSTQRARAIARHFSTGAESAGGAETALEWSGYIEGAPESAERAVGEIFSQGS